MNYILYIVQNTAYYLTWALEICFLVRAVMSFVDMTAESGLSRLVISITEPFIYPVRCLLYRIPAIEELPIDISFMITYVLISILQYVIVYSM